MDIEMKKTNYKRKKINSLYISLWFLFFTVLLTGWLYIYNMNLENSNINLKNDITEKEKSISDLEKQSKIIAYSLYNSNKSAIQKLEDYSKISSYINHLISLSRKYNIDFKWFNYSSWKLRTQVIASSDSTWINYNKTVNFIKNYRLNNDLFALFDLGLVKNVTSKNDWVDNIFNIDLKLKNNISNIFKKAQEKKLELEKKKQEELKIKKQEAFNKAKMELLKKQNEIKKKKELNKITQTWAINNN